MKKTTENEGFLAIFPCFFQPSVCVPAPSEEKVHDCHLRLVSFETKACFAAGMPVLKRRSGGTNLLYFCKWPMATNSIYPSHITTGWFLADVFLWIQYGSFESFDRQLNIDMT